MHDGTDARVPQSSRVGAVAQLDRVPPAVALRLVDALYTDDAILVHGAVLVLAAALLSYARTGSCWLLLWGAASPPIALWRLAQARVYRREKGSRDLRAWARRASVGAWLAGALWGAASLVLVAERDPFAQLLLIVCQTAFVMGGAVRNCPVLSAANGQTLLASVPLAAAALARGDAFHAAFALFVLFHVATARTVARAVHGQMLALLLAGEEKAVLAAELERANARLEQTADTDGLTGLLNRRGFDARLSRELGRCRREETPLSLLLLDVDHFKRFNDRHGHQAGDDCLRLVGQAILRAGGRPGDTAARYGGEEFAVVLPGTDGCGAVDAAERVRATVKALAAMHGAGPLKPVTVSVGAVTAWPGDGTCETELVRLADEMLYRAKREGRDRVCLHPARKVEQQAAEAA